MGRNLTTEDTIFNLIIRTLIIFEIFFKSKCIFTHRLRNKLNYSMALNDRKRYPPDERFGLDY